MAWYSVCGSNYKREDITLMFGKLRVSASSALQPNRIKDNKRTCSDENKNAYLHLQARLKIANNPYYGCCNCDLMNGGSVGLKGKNAKLLHSQRPSCAISAAVLKTHTVPPHTIHPSINCIKLTGCVSM